MLEEEEFLQADVFLSPPNEGLLSDEDSDDEEGVSAAHLSGPQLSATAEHRINYGNSVVNSLEFDESADEDAVTASTDVSDHDLSNLDSETEENRFLLLKPAATSLSWQKKDLQPTTFTDSPSRSFFENFVSPTAIFDPYFDEEVINYLTEMTNQYAHRDRGKHNFHVEHAEMRLFLAMLLLSGYNVLPRRRMYWENSEDRIVQTYLKKYAKPASNGRPRGRILSATQRVSIDVRLDRVDHYQSALPTQRRVAKSVDVVCTTTASKSGMESIDKTLQFQLQRQSLVNRR